MNYLTTPQMPDGECLIYVIRNTVTEKCYVGSTTRPYHRLHHHKRHLRMGGHSSTPLQRAWTKYGEASFLYEPLLVCDVADRDEWEYGFIRNIGYYNLQKKPGRYSQRVARNASDRTDVRKKMAASAALRHAAKRAEVYDPLCRKAWELVIAGMHRKEAHKAVGISGAAFWNWIRRNGLKERQF